MKSNALKKLGLLSMLPILLLMTACAGMPTVTLLPGAATGSANVPDGGPVVKAFVCSEIAVVHSHLGKVTAAYAPDLQKADVLAALDRTDWFDYLHRLTGDTNDTIKANALNNAVLDALCGPPKP